MCEYISAGGLYRAPLPASLAQEGLLMRDALLRDIAESDFARQHHCEIITSYDVRLPPPNPVSQAIAITQQDDVWKIWHDCITDCDAVWLVAPETDGVLARLTEIVTGQNKMRLGCDSASIHLTGSKFQTCKALQTAGILTLPTYRFSAWQALDFAQKQVNSWVAKPDDGVGCTDSGYFANAAQLTAWIQKERAQTHILQRYQPGIAASLSLLCKQGRAWLLSCNLQKVVLQKDTPVTGKFAYSGSVLNGMVAHWAAFAQIAQQVAAAFPGLCGYVGVDVLVDAQASPNQIYVLEINPRLTTSYVGLRAAMDYNPANLILDLFYNAHFQLPTNLARNVVEISI
ncbi:MAG: ATP-grasp domain-containing protein [Methylophilaceae bacterium]